MKIKADQIVFVSFGSEVIIIFFGLRYYLKIQGLVADSLEGKIGDEDNLVGLQTCTYMRECTQSHFSEQKRNKINQSQVFFVHSTKSL